MDPIHCSSLSDLQELFLNPPEDAPLNAMGRDEKQKWMKEALSRFGNYESLGKEEKGMVRKYLQLVTGYSRAQLTRNLRLALDELETESVQAHIQARTLWRRLAVWILGPVCALLVLIAVSTNSTRSNRASLVFMNPGTGEFSALHGVAVIPTMSGSTEEVKKLTQDIDMAGPIQVHTVTRTQRGIPVVHPLFVVAPDPSPGVRHVVARVAPEINDEPDPEPEVREPVFAIDVRELTQRVADRRDARMQKNVLERVLARMRARESEHAAAPEPVDQLHETFEDIYPLHGSAPTYAVNSGLPELFDLFGLGREGQILMVKDGAPRWRNIPLRDQIREAAPHGEVRSRRGGGSRSGGGGGGGIVG